MIMMIKTVLLFIQPANFSASVVFFVIHFLRFLAPSLQFLGLRFLKFILRLRFLGLCLFFLRFLNQLLVVLRFLGLKPFWLFLQDLLGFMSLLPHNILLLVLLFLLNLNLILAFLRLLFLLNSGLDPGNNPGLGQTLPGLDCVPALQLLVHFFLQLLLFLEGFLLSDVFGPEFPHILLHLIHQIHLLLKKLIISFLAGLGLFFLLLVKIPLIQGVIIQKRF